MHTEVKEQGTDQTSLYYTPTMWRMENMPRSVENGEYVTHGGVFHEGTSVVTVTARHGVAKKNKQKKQKKNTRQRYPVNGFISTTLRVYRKLLQLKGPFWHSWDGQKLLLFELKGLALHIGPTLLAGNEPVPCTGRRLQPDCGQGKINRCHFHIEPRRDSC